jgi:hypothetical protein
MSDQSNPEPRGLAAMNGWWAASGFIILLVVLGVGYVLIWGGPTATPAPAAPGTASTGTTAPSGNSGAAALTEDQQALSNAPKTTWALFHNLALPVSATAGPSAQKGPLWSGYTHTATGALLAATYLAYSTDGPDAVSVLKSQAVDGPIARAYIAQFTATPRANMPSGVPNVAGFRFVSYTPTAARIELLLLASTNDSYSSPVDLTWQDGDWKINLESAGSVPQIVKIDGPAGFIPWSAQ